MKRVVLYLDRFLVTAITPRLINISRSRKYTKRALAYIAISFVLYPSLLPQYVDYGCKVVYGIYFSAKELESDWFTIIMSPQIHCTLNC